MSTVLDKLKLKQQKTLLILDAPAEYDGLMGGSTILKGNPSCHR